MHLLVEDRLASRALLGQAAPVMAAAVSTRPRNASGTLTLAGCQGWFAGFPLLCLIFRTKLLAGFPHRWSVRLGMMRSVFCQWERSLDDSSQVRLKGGASSSVESPWLAPRRGTQLHSTHPGLRAMPEQDMAVLPQAGMHSKLMCRYYSEFDTHE